MTKESSVFGAVCCFLAGGILWHQGFWSEQFPVSVAMNRWLDFAVVFLAGGWLGTVWQAQGEATVRTRVVELSNQLLGIGQQVTEHTRKFTEAERAINEQAKVLSQLTPKPVPTAPVGKVVAMPQLPG